MSDPNDSHKESRPYPRFVPYIQIAMGMIQPDYVYINHFLREPEEDKQEVSIVSVNSSQPTIAISSLDPKTIQIHFHSRKD